LKFSYNWISELVEGLDLAPRDLERLITMKTAECEGVEEVGALLEDACGAKVLSVEDITESEDFESFEQRVIKSVVTELPAKDESYEEFRERLLEAAVTLPLKLTEGGHNRRAVVETERYGVKTVVCGAPNCRAGMTTIYVPLRKKTIQGVESDGMLASGAELGINRDHAGIIEWEGPLHLRPDSIIEIDNKSLTHRPDLWGHLGMAREVAAIARKSLRDRVKMDLLPTGAAQIQVVIENFDLCPRYSALVFDNVTVKPSPPWLQYRLEAIGLNPINNIVDFTNLIMAELSQPTHAFDRELLSGDTIFIRPAHAGETVVALNDESYELEPSNLVIADARGPVAIAGVIGGKETAIGPATRSIVLESACFHASSIRKTSSRIRLRTDASMRFEKAQDPANTVRALARAVELLTELSPGIRLVGGLADQRAEQPAPAPISLPMDWLRRKLGIDVDAAQVRDILTRLEFQVAGPDDALDVTPPSWRATKDISNKEDLVEEVGRMIGYDSIAPTAPSLPVGVASQDPQRIFHRAVRAEIAAQGFTEVYNYSFLSEEDVRAFGFNPADHVAVANPIASDQSLLRLSLLPGIGKNLIENSKRFDSFRLFEIGREIHKQPAGLPVEIPYLAAAIFAKDDGKAGLFEAKRAAECLMPQAELVPCAARAYEHPARAAEVHWRGREVGRVFELHPSLVDGRAAILYVNLESMLALSQAEKPYAPALRYPSSAFDLSVIAGARELAGDLLKRLTGFVPAEMLQGAEYVRQYAGSPFPKGFKSVSFRITVGSAERTLSSEEVGAVRNGIIEGMRAAGYELRV
jgi:phenylalanyl-tRNA synthetase beta chain